jgi:hypothetical protein
MYGHGYDVLSLGAQRTQRYAKEHKKRLIVIALGNVVSNAPPVRLRRH